MADNPLPQNPVNPVPVGTPLQGTPLQGASPSKPSSPVTPNPAFAGPGNPAAPSDAEQWPQPDGNPGDQEQILKVHHHLSAITDVGSLEGLLNVIASRCKTYRVHPDAISKAFSLVQPTPQHPATPPPSSPFPTRQQSPAFPTSKPIVPGVK